MRDQKCTLLRREADFEVKMLKQYLLEILEDAMFKTCTLLWHEAHFEVKIVKHKHLSVGPGHFWKLRCQHGQRGVKTSTLNIATQVLQILQIQ